MTFNPYEVLIDPILDNVRRLMPGFIGMKSGDMVLDVCCGTGAQVFAYARQGIHANGIDLDPRMIVTAAKNNRKRRTGKTSFLLADAALLPFNDASFDYVSVSFALHDKDPDTRDKVVSEMKRVVKPDGYLVLADFVVPLPVNFWGISVGSLEFLAGGSHYQGFKHYNAEGGLDRILADHGLVEERSGVFKGGVLRISKASIQKDESGTSA